MKFNYFQIQKAPQSQFEINLIKNKTFKVCYHFNMAFNSPHYLNGAFFDKVIKSYTKNNEAKVTDFSIKLGSKAGENFASAMYRAEITFKKSCCHSESMSVIIKTLPVEHSIQKQLTDNSPLFNTEMRMYGETLVDVMALLKASGDNTQLFPRLVI